ncbi:hypothetical protein [Luedemannella helvata]|uniref:Holin n=1 Tax=Luedemannella helvata TaxID=349315 RepID=A0ABN2JXD8_9ACTN
MRIDLWQVPLLVVAALVAVDVVGRAVVKRWRLPTERRKQVKTASLGLLAAVMLTLLWRAWSLIGTSTMANVAAIVSTSIECGMLWLTYQSYRETVAARAAGQAPDTGPAQDPPHDDPAT